MSTDGLETIRVIHHEGADKPWEVSLEGVGFLGTVRAVLNHPGRNFETQEEAIEAAEKIRELIKADRLEVEGQDPVGDATVLDPVEQEEVATLVQEGVFLDEDPEEVFFTEGPDDPFASEEEEVVVAPSTVDYDKLDSPELQDDGEVVDLPPSSLGNTPKEESSWVDESLPEKTSARVTSSSFFGTDDVEGRVRADEYKHPEEVEDGSSSVPVEPSSGTEGSVGGLPPRPTPPSSVFGEKQ